MPKSTLMRLSAPIIRRISKLAHFAHQVYFAEASTSKRGCGLNLRV